MSGAGEWGVMRLRGVRVRNLRGIDLDLPRGRMIGVTGVSGAGKSSLALETLYAEGRRRYIETFSAAARQFLERLERPEADLLEGIPPAVLLSADAVKRSTRGTVARVAGIRDLLALVFARRGEVMCRRCGTPVRPATVESVVDWLGTLPAGTRYLILAPYDLRADSDRDLVRDWLREDGLTRVWHENRLVGLDDPDAAEHLPVPGVWDVVIDRMIASKDREAIGRLREAIALAFAKGNKRCRIAYELPITEENPTAQGYAMQAFLQAWRCTGCGTDFHAPEPRLFLDSHSMGACPECQGLGKIRPAQSRGLTWEHWPTCPACQGYRLNQAACAVVLAGRSFPEVLAWDGQKAEQWIDDYYERCLQDPKFSSKTTNSDTIADDDVALTRLIQRLKERFRVVRDVGLGALPLDLPTRHLARGEAQRLALTAALSSGLVSMLYILDEPTAGSHPDDVARLIPLLRQLCLGGNTLVVVEHDPDILGAADWLVTLGPGAGKDGGLVVGNGTVTAETPPALRAEVTPRLSRIHAKDRKAGSLVLRGVTGHYLQGWDAEFPLGAFVAVTGQSGVGKSTLVFRTLVPAIRAALSGNASTDPDPTSAVGPSKASVTAKPLPFTALEGMEQVGGIVEITGQILGRGGRSNPASVLGAFSEIRAAFAGTETAKQRMYSSGTFSYNVKGGRCDACEGQGYLTVDMKFLPDVLTRCPDCLGLRYRPEVLDVQYRGKTIADVLDMSAREAFGFFKNRPRVQARIRPLLEVGLDYLRLGQPAGSLSGGEARRLRLAGFLATTPGAVVRSAKGARTVFAVEEPSAQLHAQEIPKVLNALQSLVELGHGVIAVTHRPEVVIQADWVLELGDGPGPLGGRLTACGTPKDLMEKSTPMGMLLRSRWPDVVDAQLHKD